MRRILIKFIVVLTTTINFSCSGPKVVKSLNNGGKIIPGAIHTNVPYGIDSRQWLNIYQAPSSVPTPIYIWAHANNHTANDTREFVEYLKATGISTISWESLPNFESPNAAESIWADSELMFQWVKANAEKYNLDASKIIIGGQSRGTVAS